LTSLRLRAVVSAQQGIAPWGSDASPSKRCRFPGNVAVLRVPASLGAALCSAYRRPCDALDSMEHGPPVAGPGQRGERATGSGREHGQADPSRAARLHPGPGAEECPGPVTLRASVVRRLGVDPFDPAAARRLEVTIARQEGAL
jgi:hypothetical protein